MVHILGTDAPPTDEKDGKLYELSRSAGLSHSTATDVIRANNPRIGRGPLTGEWPRMPSDTIAIEDKSYSGPAPTAESLLWLSKLGLALRSQWLDRQLIKNGLPMVVRARVNGRGGWRDGCVWLDLELRHIGGGSEFKSGRISVEACNAHDTKHVLRRVLAGIIGERSVSLVTETLLSETDLRHVAG